ncbi:DNA cytosine methyltransferase [Rhizobium lentis]|uniref:DNA cytosine methyltransferase n=1 Tax=Rhizobium lentis TaxID=1138194 RepID=UPI001C830315|nr:DNA cytosine methyltransferase [Rhizobium lentis]MBX5083061.1 DNA cytosine methyltransferase [Rhizobium lentis]MBX5095798.1 DNA cytosine methyltransferase [Rhizobium lentis]MBX5120354.1 DNA cytosine methyltransferase [Rhizobium lentis]
MALKSPVFIDVFAGCGGLSLGLMQSGWTGLFAVEHDKNAFETLSHNLVEEHAQYRFDWPGWLPKAPASVFDVLKQYHNQIAALEGTVDMLVGGPPCQGFSSAGKRNPADPRNRLVEAYLEFVSVLKPRIVLIENVRGITSDFLESDDRTKRINYAQYIVESLDQNYHVSTKLIDVSAFGVPQKRHRFFIIAARRDCGFEDFAPFAQLEADRLRFLRDKGIAVVPTTTQMAISDLEVERNGKGVSRDSVGFEEIQYSGPITSYQTIMRSGVPEGIEDTRLAKHRPDIEARFAKFIELCHAEGRLNKSLSSELKASFGLKKSAIRVLDPDQPSPTITSMPDDLIHYSEPRTLTVRENARLQSFPDFFQFRGKYTTGGERRKQEVPRFTQVANAVPPLMAEALGKMIASALTGFGTTSRTNYQTARENLTVQL